MKKLQLKKEVISNLDSKEAAMIKGGDQSFDTISTWSTMGPSEMMCQTLTQQPTIFNPNKRGDK